MTTIQNTNAIINGSTTTLDPNKTYIMTENGLVEDKAIDPMKEKWYRISEAAKELGVQTTNIRNAIHRGSLIAKEIPGRSSTGYVYMISETSLTEYLDDPKKVRDPNKRKKYNKHQYDNIKKKNLAKESEKIDTNEETPVVEKKEEVAVKSSGRYIPNDLANLQLAIAELMVKAREEAYDEAYKKGFEDGKLSVENDSIEEYRKGYEQGKKEAKSELLAALKVM